MITGNASITRNCTTNAFHVNIGMRIMFIPGARMFTTVVMKLKLAARVLMPRICRPITQKSMLIPGECALVVSGV